MKVRQFVMAYGIEQDRIRAILPKGYISLRPVLRINAEIRDEKECYVEFNTPVTKDGKRGWINIANWDDFSFKIEGESVYIENDILLLVHKMAGAYGGCPAENDNEGCFFGDKFIYAEKINEKKEFTDCSFKWKIKDGAYGKSIGKTLPAFNEDEKTRYDKKAFTALNACIIPCTCVLGSYAVCFERID